MLRSLLLPPRDRYRREWWWLLWVGVALGVLLVAVLAWERDTLVASERERLTQQARVMLRTGECTPYANVILVAGVTF